jgi:hypothetical protein
VAVVAIGSIRSCGVTTLALGLAATWPTGRRVLLVEADPAGGTLAAASGWPPEPNLVSLAAAARRGGDPGLVWEHCHQLPGGVSVLAGPPLGEQAQSTLAMLAPLLGQLGELDADVMVDCGRLDAGSPSLVLWERADRPVLAVRPRLADLQALASWLESRSLDRRVGVVAIGDGPYPDSEIGEALGAEVLARLPWDGEAAETLVSVPASARQIRLAPLVRAVRTLADQLAPGQAETTLTAGGAPAVKTGQAGRAVAVGSRVLRSWRPDTQRRSSNGNVPEEAGR